MENGGPEQPHDDLDERVARARSPKVRTGGWAGHVVVSLSALTLVGLLGVALVGRTLRAPPSLIVPVVMVLPHLMVGMVWVLFAAWSVMPDRRDIPGLLAALAVVMLGLWGPDWAPRGAIDAAGDEVTVLSYNVRRMWGGPSDGGDTLACVEQTLTDSGADVVVLLEVSAAAVDRLEADLGLSCVHHGYHQKGKANQGGLAACTRGDRWSLRKGGASRFVDDEDWYYVWSEVSNGSRVFNLWAVHLYPFGDRARKTLWLEGRVAKGQADQSAALLDRMGRLKDPTVLAGDFNSTPDFRLHRALREKLGDSWVEGGSGLGPTVWAYDLLPLRIDYVYASEPFRVVQTDVPQVGCSDHLPVVTTLRLGP